MTYVRERYNAPPQLPSNGQLPDWLRSEFARVHRGIPHPVAVDLRDFAIDPRGKNDSTSAVQSAITQSYGVGPVLVPMSAKLAITSSLQISAHGVHVLGADGQRSGIAGCGFLYSGTGPCFQIGTSEVGGSPFFDSSYENADYDGYQGTHICDVWIKHNDPDTALVNDQGSYKANSVAIQDWRGGHTKLRNIWFENFDYTFWGIQADLNRFENIIQTYTKRGLYLGPRSDQATIVGIYGFYNDLALWLDGCLNANISGMAFDNCGTPTQSPVRIGTQYTRASKGHTFYSPWSEFNNLPSSDVTAIPAAFDIGCSDGGVADSVACEDIRIITPTIITNTQAQDYHFLYYARLGNANKVIVEDPAGTFRNQLSAFLNFVGTTSPSVLLRWGSQIESTPLATMVNSGTGVPAIHKDVWDVPDTSPDKGDNSVTVTAGIDAPLVLYSTPLTATRTVTLSTTNVVKGDAFYVVRTAGGAFGLSVGGLVTLQRNEWAYVIYDGTGWRLRRTGQLDPRQIYGDNSSPQMRYTDRTTAGVFTDFRVFDDGAGGVLCRVDPTPSANTLGAAIDFFRTTDTSGARLFRIYKGDNSATIQFQVAPETGVATSVAHYIGGVVSPAQITGDQNDYNPTGADAEAWRLSTDASRNITGIAAPAGARSLRLVNVGAQNIVLQNQNVGSVAANRIITGTGADITVLPDDAVNLWYDGTTARWRVTSHY